MDQDWFTTARTLSEALPYLQRYAGAIVVIKLGGNAMSSDEAMESFARDVALMRQVGVNPVVVHGGGPMISSMLNRLGVESQFIGGKRVTDLASIEIVEMVLSGSVNKRIVQAFNRQGVRAAGLSGKDGAMVRCRPANPELGLVGEPEHVDIALLQGLFDAGVIPVLAPIGFGPGGETYNINGDTMAGAVAAALGADRLLLLTDVEGVKDDTGKLLTSLTPADVRQLQADGVIAGGMIPKTQTALTALEGGVRATVILDGRARNACLLELFTDHGAGTLIRTIV